MVRRTNTGLATSIGGVGPTGPTGPTGPAGTPTFGELIIDASATPTAIPTQNTFVIVTGWTADQTSLVTLDGPNGTITPTVGAEYETHCTFDFSCTAGHRYKFQLFKNGNPIAGHGRTMGTVGVSDMSGAISGIDVLAPGDVLTLRVTSTTHSADSVIVENANFSIAAIK